MSGNYVAIKSTGFYLPEIEMKNEALHARFAAENPDFVPKMEGSTGIKTRFYAPNDWATSDLAVRAAKQAMERGGVTAEDIDLIIVGTD